VVFPLHGGDVGMWVGGEGLTDAVVLLRASCFLFTVARGRAEVKL
jgi:hypothetical protein